MVELLNQWLPNVMDRPDVFIKSIQETFIMVVLQVLQLVLQLVLL